MADLKISQLTAATTPLAGTESVPIVQSGTTKKVLVSAFQAIGPAFSAYTDATVTSFTSGAFTKVALANEEFDTNSCFDSTTNYRFTPTLAGYYQINGGLSLQNNSGLTIVCIFKNGSRYKDGNWFTNTLVTQTHADVTSVIYFNGTTDYVELYGFQSSGGAVANNSQGQVFSTYFNGAFVRGA